jgi:hypothetical protein
MWERVVISKRSSAAQMLSDPDKGPFLQAIVCLPPDQAADDAVWLRNAELLEGRKDPRAEFLRLDRGLSAQGPLDELAPAHQARYRQMAALSSRCGC